MVKSRRFSTLLLLIFAVSSLFALGQASGATQQQTTLNVVVSLSIIGDWAENIAGEGVEVQSIVSGLENPHTYDPDPSEIAMLADADLFIEFGLEGLEPWVSSVMESNPGLSDKTLTLINTSTNEYMDYDELIDAYNPHVWMSPIKVREMCFKIYNEFSLLDSTNNNTYYSNFLNYQNKLFDLLTRIDNLKSTVKGTKVVVNHPSFVYLFDLLGIERIGAIEEKEGSEPSAQHIAEITEKIKQAGGENVLIINQPQLDQENVIGIAEETGAKVVELTPLLGVEVESDLKGEYGDLVDSYIEMIDYNLYKLMHPLSEDTNQTTSNETTGGFYLLPAVLILAITVSYRKKKVVR